MSMVLSDERVEQLRCEGVPVGFDGIEEDVIPMGAEYVIRQHGAGAAFLGMEYNIKRREYTISVIPFEHNGAVATMDISERRLFEIYSGAISPLCGQRATTPYGRVFPLAAQTFEPGNRVRVVARVEVPGAGWNFCGKMDWTLGAVGFVIGPLSPPFVRIRFGLPDNPSTEIWSYDPACLAKCEDGKPLPPMEPGFTEHSCPVSDIVSTHATLGAMTRDEAEKACELVDVVRPFSLSDLEEALAVLPSGDDIHLMVTRRQFEASHLSAKKYTHRIVSGDGRPPFTVDSDDCIYAVQLMPNGDPVVVVVWDRTGDVSEKPAAAGVTLCTTQHEAGDPMVSPGVSVEEVECPTQLPVSAAAAGLIDALSDGVNAMWNWLREAHTERTSWVRAQLPDGRVVESPMPTGDGWVEEYADRFQPGEAVVEVHGSENDDCSFSFRDELSGEGVVTEVVFAGDAQACWARDMIPVIATPFDDVAAERYACVLAYRVLRRKPPREQTSKRYGDGSEAAADTTLRGKAAAHRARSRYHEHGDLNALWRARGVASYPLVTEARQRMQRQTVEEGRRQDARAVKAYSADGSWTGSS